MRFDRIFWGLAFLLLAGYLVAVAVLSFPVIISAWRIIAGLLLLYALGHAVRRVNYFGMLISLAALYWLFAPILNIFRLHFVPLFGAAIMLSLALYILFGSSGRRRRSRLYWESKTKWDRDNHNHDCNGGVKYFVDERKDMDGDDVYRRVNFGVSEVYLHSENLSKATFECLCGEMRVYLNGAKLSHEGAKITVDCTMGELKLYVPRAWKVKEDIEVMLGSAQEKGRCEGSDGPELTVRGSVRMGSAVIIYV